MGESAFSSLDFRRPRKLLVLLSFNETVSLLRQERTVLSPAVETTTVAPDGRHTLGAASNNSARGPRNSQESSNASLATTSI
jgi:hypothetical protein